MAHRIESGYLCAACVVGGGSVDAVISAGGGAVKLVRNATAYVVAG